LEMQTLSVGDLTEWRKIVKNAGVLTDQTTMRG
jgi:hypothetical protein